MLLLLCAVIIQRMYAQGPPQFPLWNGYNSGLYGGYNGMYHNPYSYGQRPFLGGGFGGFNLSINVNKVQTTPVYQPQPVYYHPQTYPVAPVATPTTTTTTIYIIK